MSNLSIGDRVRLRYAPAGDWGTVTALDRSRVQVRWGDLQLTTRHAPESLVVEDISERYARRYAHAREELSSALGHVGHPKKEIERER
jgi:hypothetical protein